MFEKNIPYMEKVLVTGGNLGFVTTGTALYTTAVTTPNRYVKHFNVAPKQPVMWVDLRDGSVPLTKTPATLTADHLPFLHIGVGHDSDGDGLVDAIREIGPDFAHACNIKDFNGSGPTCAAPAIKALYPSCLGCETFSIEVRVSDGRTRSFGPHRTDFASFPASYQPDCDVCEGCDNRVPTCEEYMCDLVDQLNNETEITIGDEAYPNMLGQTMARPFVAVKLQEYWYSYCIAPASGTCAVCNKIDDLTTFVTAGGTNNFVGVKNPADNTQTLISQLEYAALQIQNKLREENGRHGGWAVVSKGIGDCCGVQLHVVTCDPDFAITGLSTCESGIDQFPTFTSTDGTCRDCDTTTSSTTPSCGLAIIAKMDKYDCDCYLNRVPVFTGRNIEINITSSNGKMSKYSKVVTLQEGAQAGGYGAEIQMEEYRNLAENGKGFEYEDGNTFKGDGFHPTETSKLKRAVTADCNLSYCRYVVDSEFKGFNGFATLESRAVIAVPENDSTTKTAIEALQTKLVAIVPTWCGSLVPIGCDGEIIE